MAKRAGSLWVEGAELHYVDVAGNEWYIAGDYWGSTAGKPGSLWIGNDAYLYYSGENGLKYRVPLQNMHSDAAAQKASIWVEGNYLFYAIGGAKYWTHGDYSHADGAGGHTDVPHADGHTDSSHGDSHTDSHTDSSHGDTHVDVAHSDIGHDDGHNDWVQTASPGNHQDGSYRRTISPPPTSSHTDGHYDQYGISGQYFHGDEHFDTHSDGPHGDDHSDGSHGDAHNDVAHQDGSHGDGHSDTPHQDAAHSDGASSHYDIPRYIGP